MSLSIQKSSKKRLILDLRHVHQFLSSKRFRCGDLSVAKEALCPADYMPSFDLKSGYHHVDIFPDHRKFTLLGFFEFTVLVFGLSSVHYLFTKLLKPLVKKWRSEAKQIVISKTTASGPAGYNNTKIASLQVHADLFRLGFLANKSKCIWEPTQVNSWLGSVINTATFRIGATNERITSLQDLLNLILSDSSVHISARAC